MSAPSKDTVPPPPPAPSSQPQPQPQPSAETPAAKKQETEYEKSKEKFNGKAMSEYFDPCQEAAARSLRCLARNQHDKDLCNDYFAAYRDCKKQWIEERKEERRKRWGF